MCAAHYLLERGHRVTVAEREAEDHRGCSFGNAGLVVPSHFIPLAAPGMIGTAARMMLRARSPFYIRPRLDRELLGWAWKFCRAANARQVDRAAPLLRDLHLASRSCFEQLAAAANDFGFTTNGLLMLCKSARTLEEEAHVAERARALGIPADILDARQAAELEPNLRMDVAGAVYYPRDCHLSPDRLMDALRNRVRRAGAELRWGREIRGFESRGRRITGAVTRDGRIEADEFVLCGGSWSPAISRDLGLKLPMQPGKGYSLTLDRPRKLPTTCAILTEARVAVTPMDGRLRFGGTMEMAGLDERINPLRVQGIIESIPKYYPEFTADEFKDVKPWCGLRPCSPDGLPYLGRTLVRENLTIATGHAMMGISLGPVTGRLVSQIVSGESPSIDIGLLKPDRYTC